MKQTITMPSDWERSIDNPKVDINEDIYTHSHTQAEVVGGIEINKNEKCDYIRRRIDDPLHMASLRDCCEWFQMVFSLHLDNNDMQNSPLSTIRAFDSLPLSDSQYGQLDKKQQLTIKVMLYIDTKLTMFSELESVNLKPLLRDAFRLQQNRHDVIRFFEDIKNVARRIFFTAYLKQLRTILHRDFCHFAQSVNQYDLFGQNGNSLVEMSVTETKRVIGIDFEPKRIDPQQSLNALRQRVAFVSENYPQRYLSYILTEASKCRDTEIYSQVIAQIGKYDFSCEEVSKYVEILQDDVFLYYLSPQRRGSLQLMQQQTRALLDQPFKLRVREKLRCCLFNIAATMMLQPSANTHKALQGAVHASQRQSLFSILKMVPYCNSAHEKELISQIATAILTARKYQPRFLTYRFLTEQVQFRLKIAKIAVLKEKMFGRSAGSNATSHSQTVSEEADLQFVLILDNFRNQVDCWLILEDQQFFFNIVEETISHLGIKTQDARIWKKQLHELFLAQLRSSPSLRPTQGQLDGCFRHIKLMMFSDYCQQTMQKYLNHQQWYLIFHQNIPDPDRILLELSSVTPHYIGEWT